MRALVVHAHPEPASFCSALRAVAVATLQERGWDVSESDLYAQGFNPIAGAQDFGSRRNPEYLTYALEQRHGVESGTLAPDIRTEIDKVMAADLLVLTFPIFWFSVPAMLKGWIDRVFVSGLFYGGRRIYDRGGLAGKLGLVACALGGREHMVAPGGIHGDLRVMLRPLLQGTLGYVGMTVLEPFVAHHVPYVTHDARTAMLADWRTCLETLDTRATLPMPRLADYDEMLRQLAG